jgi:hypothetical protein
VERTYLYQKDTKSDDPESQCEGRGEKSLHQTEIKIKKRGNLSVIIDVLVFILWVEYKEG